MALDLCSDAVVEGHEWKCVEIDVMLELLRRRMMLIVLIPPPRTGHAAPQAIDDFLEADVHLDAARQTVMPALMHQPTTAPLGDPVDDGPHEAGKGILLRQKPEGRSEQHNDLHETKHDVHQARLKEPLGNKLGAQRDEVLCQCIVSRRFFGPCGDAVDLRHRLQDLGGLGRARMELAERVRRVNILRVPLRGKESDDAATWVPEVGDILVLTID